MQQTLKNLKNRKKSFLGSDKQFWCGWVLDKNWIETKTKLS